MVFVRHEGRKNHGSTRETQTVKCYKCGKEIEMGELFFLKLVILDIHAKQLGISVSNVTKVCSSTFSNLYLI